MSQRSVWIRTSPWLFGFVFLCSPLGAVAGSLEGSEVAAIPEFDSAEEHLRLGVDFFLTNELDVAIDAFREAVHQKPAYADAYHNLGVALAKTGDLTGAITAWTEAERLDPESVSMRYSLAALVSYNYGVSLVRDGRLLEAMKEWQVALRLQPNFVEAHYALGLAFLAKKNSPVAVEHFLVALTLAPEWEEAYAALGRAHYESHEYGQAREAWLQALALNPREARTYADLGLLAVQEGNYHEGSEYARQALALQPDLVPAHFNLGVALLAKGGGQASAEAFAQALALDGRLTPARLLLGVAWSRMGDWAKAAHTWREALQHDPFGQEAFWLHDNLGIALASMGHFKDATKEFQWVVEQRPEWATGWSQLGLALMSERRWGEAVTALGMAARLQPNWAHLHFTLGNAHAEQGELTLAVKAFRQAVAIDANFVDALFHLGIVLRAQNRSGEAVEPLREAAVGGSREAQGLLASMYANGHGIDRNLPLAMLWWSRSSRGAISDTITRTATNQLAQLRRRLHRQPSPSTEQQDVLTGFGLIRQDLTNQAPFEWPSRSGWEEVIPWNRVTSPTIVLQWMIERALALDELAQNALREWYAEGVAEQFPPHHASLQAYWLQVAKEGDRVGCELIETTMPAEKFPAVRQACQSMGR